MRASCTPGGGGTEQSWRGLLDKCIYAEQGGPCTPPPNAGEPRSRQEFSMDFEKPG